MKFIDNIRAKRRINKMLAYDDSEKVRKIEQLSEDEEIERILLSIEDKKKRAKAMENSMENLDSLDILKNIMPTLKDDDILKILSQKQKYLNNAERGILYATIIGITDKDKRIKTVDEFEFNLSDIELSKILEDIKDSKNEQKYEEMKVNIIADKLIDNYIKYGTIMHEEYLFSCFQTERAKISVLKKCIERNRVIEEKVKKGERKDLLFDEDGKKLLIRKLLRNIKGFNGMERTKEEMILDMFKNNTFDYDFAAFLIDENIHNPEIKKQSKEALFKQQIKATKKIEAKNENKTNSSSYIEENIR